MLSLVNTPNSASPAELREVEEPTPAPNEALVEVKAFSLNRGELALLRGRAEGWRPGQDISGIVMRQAADGSGPAAGTRIVGLVDGAGWSQRAAVPTMRIAALPDGVSFAQAATLPVAGLTALRTVRLGGALLGRRALITGAAGGVGRFAVQLAARSGALVTGVVSSPERGVGLRELGAAEVVTAIDERNQQYDLILESAGGDSLAAAIHHVAPRGLIVVFGNSSGQPTPISFSDFAGHAGARIHAYFGFETEKDRPFSDDLALLAGLTARGELTPQIGAERSWRELGAVMEVLRERKVNGKAVFDVD